MESEKEFVEKKNFGLRPSSYSDARREYVALYILIVCTFRIRNEFSQP